MRTFRAMNTDVTIDAPTLDDTAEHELALEVAALFAATEATFSRFSPDSELARLNRAIGPFEASPELIALLLAARAHVAATEGVFDPTVGAALCAAGYDRSFAPGQLDRDAGRRPPPCGVFADVDIDVRTGRVARPAHIQIDLGGFLKGLTVDRAVRLAPANVAIDAGGDIALRGDGPDAVGWVVEIEDPADAGQSLGTLVLRDRAVATSAANRRRWRMGGEVSHHLIDPRTGAPSRSDLAQVTVVAPTTELADVLAKAAFVLGEDAGSRMLARHREVGAVLALVDGSIRAIGDIEVQRA